jgi:hypothetical protein
MSTYFPLLKPLSDEFDFIRLCARLIIARRSGDWSVVRSVEIDIIRAICIDESDGVTPINLVY